MRGLAILALGLAVTPALAEDAADTGLGERTYLAACAGCHGAAGDGGGPMTGILTVPVPDLTRLAERNDGVFPWLRVVHVVDGRTGLRSHGGAMPIFGLLFDGDTAVADAPDGSPVVTSARVLAVVEYLKSIQKSDG